jgi:hypothetical protein
MGGMPGGDPSAQPQASIKLQKIKSTDVWSALEKNLSKNKSGREEEN